MNPIIIDLDNEKIFDIKHIIMNYIKINSCKTDCLNDTDMNISLNQSTSNPRTPEEINLLNKSASEYFIECNNQNNITDYLIPLIEKYPKSNFALFLTVLLRQHMIKKAQNLNLSSEMFQKYRNDLLSLYQNIISVKNIKPKLLDNLCASITVLIIIGFKGQWTTGIDQLISAAKQENGKTNSNLIAALILSNVDNIFCEIEKNIDNKSAKLILDVFDQYSVVINDYINFLIVNCFPQDQKENFVNGNLFKAFIGILQAHKYFKINIIQLHGFLDFLINCISFIDVNNDFIIQICELFDSVFHSENQNLKYNYEKNFKINEFIDFLKNVTKNEDFQEIVKSLKLIQNVKKFYSSKNINEIRQNQKDVQILFTACNIFNSICENFGYIFFVDEIDDLVQDIYFYFINLSIYSINQILLTSLEDLLNLSECNYNFENYDNNKETKKQKFLSFLYQIQNSVIQNMKPTIEECNNTITIKDNLLIDNVNKLDNYISQLLNDNISNDEKCSFINNSKDFYDQIYEIIHNIYNEKDFCDKLCEFLLNSANNNDFLTIDSLMNVFYTLSFRIISDNSSIVFNLIDFVFKNKQKLFSNKRFILQFFRFIYKIVIQISKNDKTTHLIIINLLQSIEDKYLSQMGIIIINKLIISSYQIYKSDKDDDDSLLSPDKKKFNDEDKALIKDIFDKLSQYFIANYMNINYFYLYKLEDSLFHSCFFNVELGLYNNEILINITRQLFNEANKIYMTNDSEKNIKYVILIWSIIKNIGKVNLEILLNILNESNGSAEPNKNNFINMHNTLLELIKNNYNDRNLMDFIIRLYTDFIRVLKKKNEEYFPFFNTVISTVLQTNPNNIRVFGLTYNLYIQIFKFCVGSNNYNDISKLGYEILNSMNNILKNIPIFNDKVYLVNLECEFILLFMNNSPDFTNNVKSEVFNTSLNEIINIYGKTSQNDLTKNFIDFIKKISNSNATKNIFFDYLQNHIENILYTLIDHIKFVADNSTNIAQNSFEIFKNFMTFYEKQFIDALKKIFKEDELVQVICKILMQVQYEKFNSLQYNIRKKLEEFMQELSELRFAIDKNKKEFIEKYNSFDCNFSNVDNQNISKLQAVKINRNSDIYMDLYAKY